MLKIQVKLVAQELAPGIENGEYQIDSGSTVRDLVTLCANRCSVSEPSEQKLSKMYHMFNGKPAMLETVLTQDGTLHICRIVMGG